MALRIGFEDFTRHIYVIAATGVGKTTLIRLIAKGIEENQTRFPCAFFYIDPKGDDAVKFVKQTRALNPDKVTFLDPVLTSFAVNPFELPHYSSPEERERIVSVYKGFIMNIFEEWFASNQATAPRMTRIMRLILDYLYADPDTEDAPTWIDMHTITVGLQKRDQKILRIMHDKLGDVTFEALQTELSSISGLEKAAFDPVLTRISEFATDPFLRKMFSIRHSTVDFTTLIESGHFTIFRLAEHSLGSHIVPLIQSVVVLKLWFTIQERADKIPNEEDRTPVILALDEFQNIQNLQAIPTILSQARSFGLGLVLAHQNSKQLDEDLFLTIVGNCATQFAGRISGYDAQRLANTWDPRYAREIQLDLTVQPDYVFRVRIRAPAGSVQPTPMMFTLDKPPAYIHPNDEVDSFIQTMKERYGKIEVSRSVMSQDVGEMDDWKKFVPADITIPDETEWKILVAIKNLGSAKRSQINTYAALSRDTKTTEAMNSLLAKQLILINPTSPQEQRFKLSDAGARLMSPDLKDVKDAAPSSEGQRILRYALSKYQDDGLFVYPSRQDIKEQRPDLVVYDYRKEVAIAGEVESTGEIETHPEQVKINILKFKDLGFQKLHIWITADKKHLELIKKLVPQEVASDVTINEVSEKVLGGLTDVTSSSPSQGGASQSISQ